MEDELYGCVKWRNGGVEKKGWSLMCKPDPDLPFSQTLDSVIYVFKNYQIHFPMAICQPPFVCYNETVCLRMCICKYVNDL